MKKIYLIIVTFLFAATTAFAEENLAESAKSAILVDASSGEVLYEKNADEKRPPASMTKIGSMLLIMEQIDSNKLSLEDDVTISKTAADMGGSQVFLQEGEVYKVKDLLKGIAIASGNDAVVAMAEKVSGSVEEFVKLLNKRAKELGAVNTNFINPHGLDADGHYSTARDMAILARELLKHESILEYTSIYEEYLNKNDGTKTWLVNTNKLVRFYKGIDGLKTGYTQEAGYCLTATASKNNFRLISVVMGEENTEKRSSDTVKMLNYGFSSYKINIIKSKKEVLGKVRVKKSQDEYAEISLKEDATILLKNNEDTKDYQFKLNVFKLVAPIKVGDTIGTADIIDSEGNIIKQVDLTVIKDIKKASFLDYLFKNLKTLCAGKNIINQN